VKRFHLSSQAEHDLEDIWVFLAEQDAVMADQQIAQICDKLPMLANFPDMGRQRDDLHIGLRSFPAKPYVIFYIKSENALEIVRILHQSRDLDNIL
jgi:toxin ParE1/3/4